MSLVTGTFLDSSLTPFVGTVTFRPLSTPRIDGTTILVTKDILVTTNGSGMFSTVLRAGEFYVLASESKRFKIVVPDDNATYSITSLIASDLTYTLPGVTVGGTTATVTGWYRCDTLASLKAIPSATDNKVAFLLGNVALGDISMAVLYFILADSSTEDLVNFAIVSASDGGGNWIRGI
jgi:hypothetical protein